jgi:hypothetical protein
MKQRYIAGALCALTVVIAAGCHEEAVARPPAAPTRIALAGISTLYGPTQTAYAPGALGVNPATGLVNGVIDAGLILTLHWTDGSTTRAPATACAYTTSDNLSATGRKTLTVHYAGKSTNYAITIATNAINNAYLNATALSLATGATTRLIAYTTPVVAPTPAITWASSNEAVATVDNNGTVTAIAPGNATITARFAGKAVTASATLTVRAANNAALPVIIASAANATYTVRERSVPLTVQASTTDGGTISVQWYRVSGKVPAPEKDDKCAPGPAFAPSTTTPGIATYYALVTNTLGAGADATAASVVSPLVSVAVTASSASSAAAAIVNGRPYPTLKRAIAAAQPNDTIHVLAGADLADIAGGLAFQYQLDEDITTPVTAPIGDNDAGAFKGVFNGKDERGHIHTVRLAIKGAMGTDDAYTGLFAKIAGGTVRDVHLTGVVAPARAWLVATTDAGALTDPAATTVTTISAGAIAGKNEGGTIEAISSDVAVSTSAITAGRSYVGGIVGDNRGALSDSAATGSITTGRAQDSDGVNAVGGIVGIVRDSALTACRYTTSTVSTGVSAHINAAGGIAGIVRGDNATLTACTAKAAIITGESTDSDEESGNFTGGIAGMNDGGTVGVACAYTGGTVSTGTTAGSNLSGGIVGWNKAGIISTCVAGGAITTGVSTGESGYAGNYAGGIAGENDATIYRCDATNTVTTGSAPRYNFAGGITGGNYKRPENNHNALVVACRYDGAISAGDTTNAEAQNGGVYIGGIAGDNDGGTLTASHASGTVATANAAGVYAGGISGDNYAGGTVKNCHWTGTVSAEGSDHTYAGGIVGWNSHSATAGGRIAYCYAAGKVSADASNGSAGGIVGLNADSAINTIEHCIALTTSVTAKSAHRIAGTATAGGISACYATSANNDATSANNNAGNAANGTDFQSWNSAGWTKATTFGATQGHDPDPADKRGSANPWVSAGADYNATNTPRLWFE